MAYKGEDMERVSMLEESKGDSGESESGERVFHLVQDEALITRIHNDELPPDIYYERLAALLQLMFPEVAVEVVEHIVALAAAFWHGVRICSILRH